MNVKTKITQLLKENTGIHIMDSGMDKNRHWQKNQKTDFEKEPKVTLECSEGEIIPTKSTYHFLLEVLSITAESLYLQKKFKALCKKNGDSSYLWDMEEFAGQYKEKQTVNTYNGECLLSQTLQYVTFSWEDKYFLILQIHNGCDVRGGYTAPYIFEVDEPYLSVANCAVSCECGNNWQTDDAYHWYFDGSSKDEKPFYDTVKIENNKVFCECKRELTNWW